MSEEELSFSDLLFNEVKAQESVILPETMQNNIYKNQTKVINVDIIKELVGLFIGCGSVGSHTMFKLQRMGLSAFVVFDPDVIEPHNSASAIFEYKAFEDQKRHFGDYHQHIAQTQEMSPFKVDRMYHRHLKPHDNQIYYKSFKAKFGQFDLEDITSQFNENTTKFGCTRTYRESGRSRVSREYDISYERLNNYAQPNFVIMTVDNLKARLDSILHLYTKYDTNLLTLPLIDTRVADTIRGEAYCWDLFNRDDTLAVLNTFLANRYDDLDDLIDEWSNDPEDIELMKFDNDTCGDKMSIISSSMLATITCSIIRSLFKTSKEPDYDNTPRMFNYKFTDGSILPQLTAYREVLE